jgi:hypothetical protein
MQTYLNEMYHQTDENKSTNKNNFTSIKKENKNKFNTINKKQKNNNIIPQSKSSLFLNNFIRVNKKTLNKSENNINKNFKKRKKKNINVNPYQKMGNEYILNFALDNLNKYQENLLVQEKPEDEKNNFNNNHFDFNHKVNYYNNFIITKNENYESSNNLTMNKTGKNFRSSYKKNIKKEKERELENNLPQFYTNNKNYSEYFLRNDLFNDNKKEEQNEEIPEPEPYIINKYITKNKSYNNFNKVKINNNCEKINQSKSNSNRNKNTTDLKLNFTLSNLELNELKNVFEDNYIFFEDLFLLTKEDFIEMKIPIGPRNRLLNFIKKYKNYAKTFDLNELSSFMNKYKDSINSNEIDTTIGETPSTNNKYKSTMTNSKEKKLNISNLEEETNNNNKNNIIDDLNEIINQNNNNNKRCNTYKTIESRNYNDEDIDTEKDNNKNNNNVNKNIFSNSLFNEFTSYATDLKDSNFDFVDVNNTKNQNKLNKSNMLKIECLNSLISKNNSPFITNNDLIQNKNNKVGNQNIYVKTKSKMQQNTYYKNYQNIFSEIEKYQMNYEKMKKENDDRNNKINNLLDKKNKTNIQYLKMKLKNSKYYNDEDLVNESARDLNKELQKINFLKKGASPQDNDKMKYKKQNNKNPLIEEFNKHK